MTYRPEVFLPRFDRYLGNDYSFPLPYTTTLSHSLGVDVVESAEAYEVVEDWSRVRSPGRAARRRRQGHRQNITITHRPMAFSIDNGRTLLVHPQIAAQLRKEVSARIDSTIERTIERTIRGLSAF